MLRDFNDADRLGVGGDQTTPTPATQPKLKTQQQTNRPGPAATTGLGVLAIAVKTATAKADRDKAWIKLLSAAAPFLRSVAVRSIGDDVDYDDLLSAAQLGFIEAVKSWDHVAYPAGFASWARQMMRTEVRSAVRASRTIRGKRDVDVMAKIGSESAVWQGHVDEE